MAKQASFEVIVRGQYHSMNDVSGTPTLKPYEEKFVLPSQEAALSNICKHLLSPRLKRTHPDFIRYRTHELVSITLIGYKPNAEVLQMSIEDMNITELYDFCILKQLMIDPYKYGSKDIYQIREMVQKAYSERRQIEKDKRTSKQAAIDAEGDQLRKANDLPPASTDTVINVNELKARKSQAQAEPNRIITPTISGPVEADEPLPPPEVDDAPADLEI